MAVNSAKTWPHTIQDDVGNMDTAICAKILCDVDATSSEVNVQPAL